MEAFDREKRERLILEALVERRLAVEEETRKLRLDQAEQTRREAELRDELAMLNAILQALPKPRKESDAPSLFTPPPARPSAPASAGTPAPRRRRKGTRREQMLPKLRAQFGAGAFTAEDVTNLLLEEEPGERRKAYFAAWSLCRDLAEDGLIATVAEEGSGRRVKRTYRFAESD